MTDDRDRCEWVNVSSGLDWAGFNIPPNTLKVISGWVFTGQMTQPTVSKHWRNRFTRVVPDVVRVNLIQPLASWVTWGRFQVPPGSCPSLAPKGLMSWCVILKPGYMTKEAVLFFYEYGLDCVFRKLGYLQNKGSSLLNFVPNSGLWKFGHSTPTITKCDKHAIVVSLLLTSPVDDDHYLFIALSIQLCVQHNGRFGMMHLCKLLCRSVIMS